MLSSEQKPEVLRFAGGTDADLRLEWQEFLIRMIANAFESAADAAGSGERCEPLERGRVGDEAFRGAMVPVAKLLDEHITRDVFGKRLGWREFEFCFNELEARDEATELQIQMELLKAGVLTVSEVRALRGLGAVQPIEQTEADRINQEIGENE